MKSLFRVILIALNIVAVGAFLLSTAAGLIPPSKSELVSFLSYGFIYLLLANIGFFIIWLCHRRWMCLLSAIPIAIRYSMIPLFIQFGGTEEATVSPDQFSITILDQNTHMFHGPKEVDFSVDSNAQIFLDMVRDENPDIITAQEFYTPGGHNLKDSLAALGFKYTYGPNRNNSGPYGVAIYSKYPFENETDLDTNRKFYVDVKKDGKRFRVACVHMDSYMLTPDNLENLKKKDSITPVTEKLKATFNRHEQEWNEELLPLVQDTTLPLIICGDFNDPPTSHLYQCIVKHLKDSYVEQGSGWGDTYHGDYPNFRIDYIFHSNHWEVASYKKIINDLSDHYAIKSTLILKP